jgi:glycosyltransferase involved in cell wall biosynthesis
MTAAPCRVLYLARAPFVSGAERALVTMLRLLDRRAVEPMVVLGEDSPMEPLIRELNVPVARMAMVKRSARHPLAWWRSLRQLRAIVRQFQPDILHANDVPSCQAMSVVGGERGIARVLHVRWALSAGEAGWWARAGVEEVLCISHWVRQTLGAVRHTPLREAHVALLPDAVDWPASGPAQPQAMPPWPVDPVVLGFAGQLVPDKGLDLVIEAMGRLPADRRPRLLIAGKDTQRGGQYEAELQALAQREGIGDHITWLGFLPNVGELYRQVSAVVCPSRLEPLGLVPLEAAQWARPCIANRVGGLAHTVADGRTGWLVEPTVEDWHRVLRHVIAQRSFEATGLAAYRRTWRRHHPQVYRRRLMRRYAHAIARCRATASR